MPKQTYPFKQSTYMPGRRGVCYCLASLWCRAMLEANKDGWGSPTNSGEERCSSFSVAGMKNRVSQEQAVFLAKTARGRGNADAFAVAGSVVTILNRNGYAPEAAYVLDVLLPAANSVLDAHMSNLTKTIEKFGVVCGARTKDVPWGYITNAVPFLKACVVAFSTGEGEGHAIGIYQTYGWKSTDFYGGNGSVTILAQEIKA
jgi:hypothetical protein